MGGGIIEGGKGGSRMRGDFFNHSLCMREGIEVSEGLQDHESGCSWDFYFDG